MREGRDGRQDYQSVSIWFRKAADHGVTDSKYNSRKSSCTQDIGVEDQPSGKATSGSRCRREGDRESARSATRLAQVDAATAAAAHAAVRTWAAGAANCAANPGSKRQPAVGWPRRPIQPSAA